MTGIVDHLRRLGLNEYEARAYVATVTLGEGTVKEISEESGVPRSRAYDVMERLARKGLVEAGSTNPICYRANDPLVASVHLMEEIKQANDVALRELREIGRRAEKRDNPVWTVKGEWAIDHKVHEVLESAEDSITVLCFNNRDLIRYAALLTRMSERKAVTVVVSRQPESFVGLLGRSRLMRLRPTSGLLSEMDGALSEKGFITKDGRYSIEMVMLADRETSLVLTKERERRMAIIITGTILNFFSRETIGQAVKNAKEVGQDDEG